MPYASPHASVVSPATRARDWAEIQERVFVPLYDAVYDRLGVGVGSRLLEFGCGSGLALLRAAARGAHVTGTDTDPELLRLARQRLLPEPARWGTRQWPARLVRGTVPARPERPYTVVAAFGAPPPATTLRTAAALAERGAPVVLAAGASDWPGPAAAPSRPETARAGAVALVRRAGLRPTASGEVDCPFGYPGLAAALRGLLATGAYDGVIRAAGVDPVARELAAVLRPYRRPDGAVWLPTVQRYVIATPVR